MKSMNKSLMLVASIFMMGVTGLFAGAGAFKTGASTKITAGQAKMAASCPAVPAGSLTNTGTMNVQNLSAQPMCIICSATAGGSSVVSGKLPANGIISLVLPSNSTNFYCTAVTKGATQASPGWVGNGAQYTVDVNGNWTYTGGA